MVSIKSMECEESGSESPSVSVNADINSKLSEQQKVLIDKVISSEGVHFKSQQIGEPELEESEKRKIVEDVLNRSHGLFLSKYGKHLCREHLEFFNEPTEQERYEVEFYLKQLGKSLKRKASEISVKNRRFDALKRMVTDGSYFSEEEMRKRNPLLYEQLVGQYLSEEERRMREEIDTSNITIVNLLMEQIERENIEELKKTQEEDEDCVREEEDTSDEDESKENFPKAAPKLATKVTPSQKAPLWGEMANETTDVPLGKASWIKSTCEVSKASSSADISEEERSLLFEEFRTNMFENFLQGKDADFDYSKIDSNPEHDDVNTLNQDAEDKYFDSESPETNSVRNMEEDTDDDEFEKFMAQVRSEERTNQITSGIKHLNSDLSHNS